MNEDKYIVRLWDGGDGYWIDISKPLSKEDATSLWNKETKNGTCNTKYEDYDYYAIFPANTVMLYAPPSE